MDLLGDPAGDRMVKGHVPPPLRPLDPQLMFPESNKQKPDWKVIRDHLSKEGRIGKEELIKLVRQASKVFKNEGNLLYLQDPLTIVGDVHGQFYDLLKILDVGGDPESCKYLFLGDYVDRGPFSCEVIILLFALKINYPKTIFMLRGNHECRQLTAFFNFYEECKYKYDQEVYDIIMDSFDNIPLACIVNGQFIALHGGISPELINVEDINTINRFTEPPKYGIFCDLIWADPVENDDGVCEGPFRNNDVRGCSYFYGQDAVTSFLERNNLISVIRAHEAQLEGYKMHRWNGGQEFPMVITIFSAPNYCDVYNNKGAVIKFDNNALNIQQFNSSEHPYLLPNFMDIFTWSVPFVTEKITELLYHLISAPEDEVISDDEVLEEDIQKFNKLVGVNTEKKTDRLKSKIKFISKMMKMQRILRIENESIVQIKGACADRRIPKGLLSGSGQGLKDGIIIPKHMNSFGSLSSGQTSRQYKREASNIAKFGGGTFRLRMKQIYYKKRISFLSTDMDLDVFGIVAESEEDDYLPNQSSPTKQIILQPMVKSCNAKREQFRQQIRKEKTELIFSQRRGQQMPRLKSMIDMGRLFNFSETVTIPVQDIFKQLEEGIQNKNNDVIKNSIKLIALISDDENNINSLFLIKLQFISFASILMESDHPLQQKHTFMTLGSMSKVSEFQELDHEIILKTIHRGLNIVQFSDHQDVIQHIIVYFSHVFQLMPSMRDKIVQYQTTIEIFQQLNIIDSLKKTFIIFIDIFLNKYPQSQVDEMGNFFLLIDKCLSADTETELLQALITLCRQASPKSMNMLIETQIITFLMNIMRDHNFVDFEFYRALTTIKLITRSCDRKIQTILIKCGILEIVDSYVYHKYQKLRTATLNIVIGLCQSNHQIIQLVMRDSIIQKLINVLVSDKPINTSMVLQIIINIMTYGGDPDYAKLLDLGIVKHLLIILQNKEASILLLGLRCCEILIIFGQSYMIKFSLSVNPILQQMLSYNLEKEVEQLQLNQNEEVYLKANQFIQAFFEYEMK